MSPFVWDAIEQDYEGIYVHAILFLAIFQWRKKHDEYINESIVMFCNFSFIKQKLYHMVCRVQSKICGERENISQKNSKVRLLPLNNIFYWIKTLTYEMNDQLFPTLLSPITVNFRQESPDIRTNFVTSCDIVDIYIRYSFQKWRKY